MFGKNLKFDQRNNIVYNLISSSKPTIVDVLIGIVMQFYLYYAIIVCKINQENKYSGNKILALNIVNVKMLAISAILSKLNGHKTFFSGYIDFRLGIICAQRN